MSYCYPMTQMDLLVELQKHFRHSNSLEHCTHIAILTHLFRVQHIIPLDMKGYICHFVKWQIYLFVSKAMIIYMIAKCPHFPLSLSIWFPRGVLGQVQQLELTVVIYITSYIRRDLWWPLRSTATVHITDTQYSGHPANVLFKCWASVVDGGPTLKEHWFNVSCLLDMCIIFWYICVIRWNII